MSESADGDGQLPATRARSARTAPDTIDATPPDVSPPDVSPSDAAAPVVSSPEDVPPSDMSPRDVTDPEATSTDGASPADRLADAGATGAGPASASPPTPRPTITASAFTSALSLAANGVSIVTTAHAGRRAGLTVSSMCSVCAEPALLLACVNADNEFCALADASGRFAVNILGEGQQGHSNVFAGLDGDSGDRFERIGRWTTLTSGAPILADALVALDCELDTTLVRGTHRIFLGHVVDVRTTRGEPLVYTARGYAVVRPAESD